MTDLIPKLKIPSYEKQRVDKTHITKLGRGLRRPTTAERLLDAYRAVCRAPAVLVRAIRRSVHLRR